MDDKDKLLIVLTVAGSALCWWPANIEPSIDFPRWILLVLVALIAGLSTILANGRWSRFVGASVGGAIAGMCSGFFLFPWSDGIARSYGVFVLVSATLAVVVVSVPAGLIGRKLSVPIQNHRRAVWFAFVCCVAFGPVALALTPPLVAHRVARNEVAATERFEALKSAVEQTRAEDSDPERICDGQALKRHYFGPSFRDEDWQYIAGNYVKQDGYVFMVYCREQNNGYTIDAWPARGKADGERRFCTDESRKIGCRMLWNRSRNACLPCTQ